MFRTYSLLAIIDTLRAHWFVGLGSLAAVTALWSFTLDWRFRRFVRARGLEAWYLKNSTIGSHFESDAEGRVHVQVTPSELAFAIRACVDGVMTYKTEVVTAFYIRPISPR